MYEGAVVDVENLQVGLVYTRSLGFATSRYDVCEVAFVTPGESHTDLTVRMPVMDPSDLDSNPRTVSHRLIVPNGTPVRVARRIHRPGRA